MVDLLGTRLGRYELRERIGKGGMAWVYKAWDNTLERWVAVKVLHEHLADEKDFKARFEREAKLIASLSHPNIIQVYDFDVIQRNDAATYYMVMAYVAGGSLRQQMEEFHEAGKRLPLSRIKAVLSGVADALAYAHQHGMVHRDVTPGNILFDDQGRPVLADFGIARLVSGSRLTQTGMASGTPLYMSPEQGVGDPGDHRSDIYAVGVILFEMLTGSAPYVGDSAFAIIFKHVNDPVPSPLDKNPNLPRAVESVIFRALAKDPNERYQSISELNAEIQSLSLETGAETRFPIQTRGMVKPALKPSRSRFLSLVGVVGIVAALLFGGLVMLPRLQGITPNDQFVTLAAPPITTKPFAPAMTAGPLIFKETFDSKGENPEWPIITDAPNYYSNIQDGVYFIRNQLRATALTRIFYECHQYPAGYIYEADLTISERSQRDSGSGIVFRFLNDDNYYVFAINGQGQVSIWSRFNGEWTELRNVPGNWTPAASAKPAGQVNRLRLIDEGRRLIAFVNGVQVIDIGNEPKLSSGAIGIYLATTQSGRVSDPRAEVSVDNFKVEELVKPTPGR